MQPEFSIVIPTFDRANILRGNLKALFNQTLDKRHYEIIVIDDGSVDGTSNMLSDLKRETSHILRTYWQENKLAGSARNLGIQKANGPIVLFIDSDILPDPDLLRRHFDLHTKYPENEISVLGRVITGDSGKDLLDPDDRKVTPCSTTKGGDPLVDASYFTTQNVSLKRRFVIDAGSFTPGLPCLQDMELAFRLKAKGLKLIYSHEAVGVHMDPLDTVGKVILSGKKYGRTLAEWYDRSPELRREIASLGGGFNGGWSHFSSFPREYLKNAVRRWVINRVSASIILQIIQRIPDTNPPKKILGRCCREIWAYYYRLEFEKRRRELLEEKSEA